jgi:hypothetical protein
LLLLPLPGSCAISRCVRDPLSSTRKSLEKCFSGGQKVFTKDLKITVYEFTFRSVGELQEIVKALNFLPAE